MAIMSLYTLNDFYEKGLLPNLIVGGDSVIGNSLATAWNKAGVPYFLSTRKREKVRPDCPYIDLSSYDWNALEEYDFDSVVFCAAITNLSACEDDPQSSYLVNVDATLKLAQFVSKKAKYLLFLSSNQVFDGTQPMRKVGDPVCPINEYGRQKLVAENGVLRNENSAILRLTKVIHPTLSLLVHWEKDLKNGRAIDVYGDMSLAPVYMYEVIEKIMSMIQRKDFGIHHLPSKRDVSYYDFVLDYFKHIPDIRALVRKVSSKRGVLYPQFTSLM